MGSREVINCGLNEPRSYTSIFWSHPPNLRGTQKALIIQKNLCLSPMVTGATPSVHVAHLTGDREAGTLPTITSCSYQPFLLQMENATIACLHTGLLSSPSLSLCNPPDWNTLQGIMLLGERASACASFGQPFTTPMSSFAQDLASHAS